MTGIKKVLAGIAALAALAFGGAAIANAGGGAQHQATPPASENQAGDQQGDDANEKGEKADDDANEKGEKADDDNAKPDAETNDDSDQGEVESPSS